MNEENLNQNIPEQPVETLTETSSEPMPGSQQNGPVPPIPPVPPVNPQPQYTMEQGTQGKGMSIASMVLGIVSLCLCCVWYLSAPCAIVGLVLGTLSLVKHNPGRNMAWAGVICSGVGIFITIALLIFVAIFGVLSYTGANLFHY